MKVHQGLSWADSLSRSPSTPFLGEMPASSVDTVSVAFQKDSLQRGSDEGQGKQFSLLSLARFRVHFLLSW